MGLKSGEAERFQFGRQQEDIGDAEIVGDVCLFSDKCCVFLHAELLGTIVNRRAFRTVADHDQFCIGACRTNLREDLDAIIGAFYLTEIRNVDEETLAIWS